MRRDAHAANDFPHDAYGVNFVFIKERRRQSARLHSLYADAADSAGEAGVERGMQLDLGGVFDPGSPIVLEIADARFLVEGDMQPFAYKATAYP